MSGPLTRRAQRVDPFLVEVIAQGIMYHGKGVGVDLSSKPDETAQIILPAGDVMRMREAEEKRRRKVINKLKLISN